MSDLRRQSSQRRPAPRPYDDEMENAFRRPAPRQPAQRPAAPRRPAPYGDAAPRRSVPYGSQPMRRPAPRSAPQARRTGFAMQMADFSREFSPEDVAQNKALAVLAYFGILVLVPIFAAPNSRFARFHANQGLLFAIGAVAYLLLAFLLSMLFLAISWRMYFVGTILYTLGGIGLTVLAILGIVNAAGGRARELPLIGRFRLLR